MNNYIEIIKEVSKNNKYLGYWENIITRALVRKTPEEYCEKHHIVPSSFKLIDKKDKSNLVILTAREHILVHMLMTKFIENTHRNSCLQAFHCMCFFNNGGINKRYPSTRQLAYARECASIANSYTRGHGDTPKWMPNLSKEECISKLQAFTDSGLSDRIIANKFKTSNTSVNHWRKIYNIQNRRPLLKDKKYLYNQHIILGKTTTEIADKLLCTNTAVENYLKKFNIEKSKTGHVDGGTKLAKKKFYINLNFFGFESEEDFIILQKQYNPNLIDSKPINRIMCNFTPNKIVKLTLMSQMIKYLKRLETM